MTQININYQTEPGSSAKWGQYGIGVGIGIVIGIISIIAIGIIGSSIAVDSCKHLGGIPIPAERVAGYEDIGDTFVCADPESITIMENTDE